MARECGAPEGKGAKGSGKAAVGEYKGKGKADATKGGGKAGKGFGYQGTSYNCGLVRHKRWEGPQPQKPFGGKGVDEVAPGALEVGVVSVWGVGGASVK